MVQALGAAAAVLAIAAIIWCMDAIGKGWSRQIDAWGPDDDLAAAALVPEFAAARTIPAYQGGCRCSACTARPSEPCSDYDGD